MILKASALSFIQSTNDSGVSNHVAFGTETVHYQSRKDGEGKGYRHNIRKSLILGDIAK